MPEDADVIRLREPPASGGSAARNGTDVKVQVLGCSHHNAPLRVRERLAFDSDQTRSALGDFRRAFPDTEVVIVSTCNRVEVYTGTARGPAPSRRMVAAVLARFHRIDPGEVFEHLYEQDGREAVRHLFLVASSLDSMVVGEPQILSQVKDAYRLAVCQQATGPLTHAAFQTALRVARRVANETGIHRHRVSIPSVAVADFAQQMFERFEDKKVLVIGAGEMAEEILRYLREEGMADVTVVNRCPSRAAKLAGRWQAQACPWDRRLDRMGDADLVISATAARTPVVDSEAFRRVIASRQRGPLLILDLAVPRDFDPAVANLPDVFLYSVDDLRQVCRRNRERRADELPAAIEVIEQETRRFMEKMHRRAISPVVQRLRDGWQEPKEKELERLFRKLSGLDGRSCDEIRKSFDRLVNKLLHPPLESLHEEACDGVPTVLLDALVSLFRLRD